MKKLSLLFFCLLLFSTLFGQESYRLTIGLGGKMNVAEVKVDYMPLLQNLEAPYPDGESEKARMIRIKKAVQKKYPLRRPKLAEHRKAALAGSPWMSSNFRSNTVIQGVPNDNDMSISNGGKLISVINSNIWMLDEHGSALKILSLDAWADTLGLSANKYDPRTLYDPVHDRFIIVCLNGTTDSTSNIVVGFSQTNDPTGDWNMYALPGDPLQDSLWTDYPILAISEYELFITGNLLYNSQPWQTGFAKSICWQIDLDNAYTGDSLDTRLWVKPEFGGAPIRNLCPVQGGSMPSGPNMYLLSNRNFGVENDTVFIMEITDTLGSPTVQLLVDHQLSDVEYTMPPNAFQQFNQQLATNDARWLGAFIENDNIQFVGNTVDTATGLPAIYHGIVTDVANTRTVHGHVLTGDTVAFGYPGIAWIGMAPGADEALIGVNYAGAFSQAHAGCGAIYYDGAGDYSELAIAKRGTGFINAITGVDRWGDYMGVQTRYNAAGVVWTSGTWGQTSHLPATWVAKFNHPAIVNRDAPVAPKVETSSFPNPFHEIVAVEFRLEMDEFVEIGIYDLAGRRVETLLRSRVKAGLNRFTFSPNSLEAGTYLLQIRNGEALLATKKVVKI